MINLSQLWKLVCTGIVLGTIVCSCHKPSSPSSPSSRLTKSNTSSETAPTGFLDQHVQLTDNDSRPCESFESAALEIWSLDVRNQLELTLKVYEGKLEASEAENLVGTMDEFQHRWLADFTKLCDHKNANLINQTSFKETVKCLAGALSAQRAFLISWVAGNTASMDEIGRMEESVNRCEEFLRALGDGEMKENPF